MPRPRISTNFAISADGKISSVARAPSGWTSAEDRARFNKLRETADALMVGRGTWSADRMTMTVPGRVEQPLRCIVSKSGQLDPAHPIFEAEGGPIHLLVTDHQEFEPDPQIAALVRVHRKGLDAFLETLSMDFEVNHLHCEGGGELVRALAEIDAIDEFHLTIAGHTAFGGQEAPTTTGLPLGFLPGSLEFELTYFEARPDFGECYATYSRTR